MAKKSEKRKEQKENNMVKPNKKAKIEKSDSSSMQPKQTEINRTNSSKFDIELENSISYFYIVCNKVEIPALRVLNPKSNITVEKQTSDLSIPVGIGRDAHELGGLSICRWIS